MLLVISPNDLRPEQILSSSLLFSRKWQSTENVSWDKGELAGQPTFFANLLVSWKHIVHCLNFMTQMTPRCKNQDGLLSRVPQPWSQKDTHSQYLSDPEKLMAWRTSSQSIMASVPFCLSVNNNTYFIWLMRGRGCLSYWTQASKTVMSQAHWEAAF